MSTAPVLYGTFIGHRKFYIAWNYNLSAGSRFIDTVTPFRELRFYGIVIGEWAIGGFRRVLRVAP